MRSFRFSESDLFALFRISLGLYLFCHFVYLIPYGQEIFSSQGVLPSAAANYTYGFFPNILNEWDSPNFILSFLGILSLFSLLFLARVRRRWVSLLLWYGWVCLYHRNNLIHNPSVPYTSWLLLACALIPEGEPILPFYSAQTLTQTSGKRLKGKQNQKKSQEAKSKNDPNNHQEDRQTNYQRDCQINWKIPRLILISAWILLGLGYSISGFDKLWNSPSWRNGQSISFILTTPLARDWFLNRWILSLPTWALSLLSYGTVFTELLFGPLVLWSKTRFFAWLAMLGLQIGILFTVDFPDLTLGMLIAQLFVFDPSWLKPKKRR